MDLDEILKALASPVRRDILAWLKNPAQEFPAQLVPFEHGVCVGKIYERAGLSQSTVSAHLATLHKAGLVSQRREGQWVYYQRDESVIQQFLAAMGSDL